MSMEEADAEKKAEMPVLDLWGSGRNPRGHRSKSASKPTVATGTKSAAGEATMEAVVTRENLLRALRAVERNAGVAGVDVMTTEELRGYLRAMGAAQEATPGRDLSAAACAAGGYSQARRRDANAGTPTVAGAARPRPATTTVSDGLTAPPRRASP